MPESLGISLLGESIYEFLPLASLERLLCWFFWLGCESRCSLINKCIPELRFLTWVSEKVRKYMNFLHGNGKFYNYGRNHFSKTYPSASQRIPDFQKAKPHTAEKEQ